MIKLYTTPNCLGSNKAREFLVDNKLEFEEKNFLKTPLTKEELMDILFLTENGFEDLIGVHSKTCKQLDLDFDEMTIDELIALILKYPTMLHRPIIIEYAKTGVPVRLLVGYSKDEIKQFLNKSYERFYQVEDKFTADNEEIDKNIDARSNIIRKK